MSAMPSFTLDLQYLDAGSDRPRDARATLYLMGQTLQQVMDAYGEPFGLPTLDAQGHVPEDELSAAAVLNVLKTVDGVGSGLDADLLAGHPLQDFIRADGSIGMSVGLSSGFLVQRTTATNNARARALTVRATNSPSGPSVAGYGVEVRAQLDNASGLVTNAGYIAWDITDPTTSSVDTDLVLGATTNDVLQEQLRLRDRKLVIAEQFGTPAPNPPANSWYFYFKSGGAYIMAEDGTETLLASATGFNHNDLANLTVGDPHTQYLRTDGGRTMTGDLSLGQHSVHYVDQVSDPAAPAAGELLLYSKSGGLYVRTAAGIVGPFATGGVTDHGNLDSASLLDDDHPQYLLRQPTAHVVINDSGGAWDFVIESDTSADMFHLDGALNAVGINCAPAGSGAGYLQVTSSAAVRGLLVTQTGGADAVHITKNTSSTGAGLYIEGTTPGLLGLFERTAISTTSAPVLQVSDADNANAGIALKVTQAGAVATALEVQTLNGRVFAIDTDTGVTEIVINDDANSNVHVRVEGETVDHLFWIDPDLDRVSIGGTPAASARFNVIGGSWPAAYFSGVVSINRDGGGNALVVTGGGLEVDTTTARGGNFVKDLSGGVPSSIKYANLTSTVVDAGDDAPCLRLDQRGSGDYLVMQDNFGPIQFIYTSFPHDGGVYMSERGDMPTCPFGGWGLWAGAEGFYQVSPDGVVSPLGGGGVVTGHHWRRRPAVLEATVTLTSGASVNLDDIPVPAGCYVEFVRVLVLDPVPGGLHCGVAGATQRFAKNMAGTLGETNESFTNEPQPFKVGPVPMTLVLTSATGAFSGGQVHVSVFVVRCDLLS